VNAPPRLTSQLLHVGPHHGAHRVAARAGVSVLVPLLVLWAAGHLEVSIYATFGAFTSLYGRNHVGLSRARMQATLAVVLTVSVVLGVTVGLSAQRSWWAVPVAAVVAAGGSLLSDAQDWHPPGPLFLVFAFTACASLRSGPSDVAWSALVAGGSAVFSLAIGSAGTAVRRLGGAPHGVRHGESRPGTGSARGQVARRHVARNAGSVLLAGGLATAVGIGHPYWAMVSAVVPLAAREVRPQVVRGVHRVAGTMAGLVLAALLLAVGLGDLLLILVITALQAAAELLVGRNYALALVAITPLALLMVHLVSPVPAGSLLLDRGVETVIGVAVGLLVGWFTRSRIGTNHA
jgi:uncharacterized membrane protein